MLAAVFTKISEALPLPPRGAQGRWLVAVLMVATALLAFRSIDDLDYGIHVGTGRWILQNGRVPSTDPFTWSIPEHVYIAITGAFRSSSRGSTRDWTIWPVLLRFALVLLTAAALVGSVVARKVDVKVDVVIAGVCGLLALVAAEVRFAVRPELFTYLFLALLMLALDLWRNGSRRVLLVIPLICIGWINTHIYILGFIILGAHLIEQVYRRTIDKGFLGVCLLAAAALFVNPYGLDAVMEPLRLFTRMSKDNIFAQHITEVASPLTLDDNPRRYGLTVHFGAWASLLVLAVPAIVALYVHLVNYLLSSNNWTVVYYDSVGVVFVRKEGPNGHLPIASLPLPIQSEQEQWAYLKRIEIRPSVIDSFSRWLLGGEELPLEKEQIEAFLLKAGRWAEAERPLLEAAVEAPNFWETLNNLG